jgi:hypothetical protein
MASSLFTAFALIAAGQAQVPAAPASEETYVPNVSSEGVAEWEADGETGLYIMSQAGRWYYARTVAPCPHLTSTMSLGFETQHVDRLDRFGTIVAEGWRCRLESVTYSDGPPPLRVDVNGRIRAS